jgi:hypothetical protein
MNTLDTYKRPPPLELSKRPRLAIDAKLDQAPGGPAVFTPTGRQTAQRLGREAACLRQLIRLPEPGEDLTLIMAGNWHGSDLIGAILQLSEPAKIETLDIATLGFNKQQAIRIMQMIDAGEIGRCRFVVSAMFRDQNHEEYKFLADGLAARGQTIGSGQNHTKLLLFKMTNGLTYAVHGSLNLRRCHAYEQMAISTSATLYAFFERFVDDFLAGRLPSSHTNRKS